MVDSIILDECVYTGAAQGYPKGLAGLGYFESTGIENNADNVFVLVVHYDFKWGNDGWQRRGVEYDVENLRKTFAENRNCAFRECSLKKEDLLALLRDEKKLKRFFGATEVLEPDIFFLIILSHGQAGGVIFTDFLRSPDPKDYENFTTKDLFQSINQIFPKCLKIVFLGPSRGQLEDSLFHPYQAREGQKNDLTKNQNSSRVSFEPKMHNLIIFYSTVETTMSRRDSIGTWFVRALCMKLNEMRQKLDVANFFTGVQNIIHQQTIRSFPVESTGQTPEFKMFPCERKFIFHPLKLKFPSCDATDAPSAMRSPEEEKLRSIHVDWWNPKTKKVYRGRRAVIFHYGEKSVHIEKLDTALVTNLGFETIDANINKDGLDFYLSQSDKSWSDYSCFAAFFFAEIEEQEDGQVCICLNENEKVPIGKLIHGLLGPKNGDWIGKPKLFFFVDTKSVATDSAGGAKIKYHDYFFRATNHSGWLVFTLRNAPLLQNFLEIFESQELKKSKSLQENLANLLIERMNDASEAMMISTLPHSLIFQDLGRNFVPLKFSMKEIGFESWKELNWDELLNSKQLEAKDGIWLLSSFSGSGKSTVMRELAFQLQRMLACEMKVFLVGPSDTYGHFSKEKNGSRKVPSLASVVSIATRIRETEIQNLIVQKRIMLMLDGFDEMCPFYRDQVLDVFAEAVEKKVKILISTQPHEEVAILSKLGKGNQVFKLKILPLDWRKQIDFLMMTSHKSEEECKLQIYFYRSNGLEDILGNPLHLKMIAELGDLDYKKGIDFYEYYKQILDKKLRFALKELESSILEKELNICETELRIAAVKFLCGDKTDILKYPNNGIVTISNGRAQFVHQTFAEFLAAAHFIDCLFDGLEMPFDILKEEFRQVRKFVDFRISMSVGDEKSNLLTSLEKYLKNSLTKSSIENVILQERLVNFSSVAENLVTFNAKESNELNYDTSDHILVLASERVENFALGLLKKGAYEKLEDPNSAAVEILRDAIENNFAQLFSEMGKKFADSMDLVRNNMKIKKTSTLAAYRNHHKVFFLVLEQKILDQGELQVALKSAVRGNSAECVEVLIEHGARTASLDESNFDHLNSKTTEALLKTKDEPELKLASRIFNRSLVDEYCNAEVAKYLLERFKDEENAEFEVSSCALFDVAGCEDFDDTLEILCRWLVEKRGFQVREKDWTGRNAFHCAAEKGNFRLLKYLLEKDSALTKTLTDKRENAMHLSVSGSAAPERKIEMCNFLHYLDADLVMQKTKENESILLFAVKSGNFDVFEWLAEVFILELDNGWNAMHFAASFSWKVELELLEYLHKKNPRLIRERTIRNETPLHLVAKNKKGEVKIYNWFISKGIDASVQNSDGQTALQAASEHFLKNYEEH